MSSFGPGQRAVFEAGAARLYDQAVADRGLPVDDPRIADGAELHEAFRLLREIGLVVLDDEGEAWRAVDPATVQSQVVAPMGMQGAELIAESASWARAFNNLSHTWRRSPAAIRGPLTEVRGEQISPFIAAVVADAEDELLTAQPQADRSGQGLGAATQRDIQALDRGVRLRTLYQHAARRNTRTADYVASVTRHGAEVRTLDEFFNRLIVVDRRIAVIPGSQGPAVALAVREPAMVAYLVDMFERHWERARSFTDHATSLVRDIAEEQRAMTIRMLIEGHPDQSSAKRLGVSPRTYAGYVAELKTEFEAETRFQLGYAMARRGVSGRDDDRPRRSTVD